MKLVKVVKSSRPDKKLMAVFVGASGRSKKVHFGARGMDDYTRTHDKAQRERYLKRHAKEDWDKPDTAGSLARWILWGPSTDLDTNIRAFKARFNL